MEKLIILENVSKHYNNKCILSNVNLTISKGETLAIIGANGTGKSTLLRMIAGLSNLSSGRRSLCDKGDKLKIGYVPDNFPKLNFTPYEYICYMGKIQGLPQKYIDNLSEELFDIFSITSMKSTRIKYLSKGTIQKVAVIQSIISKPDILLLDEPLSGQDNKSQQKFIGILERFKTEEMSIILACHEMFLVDKLADKVVSIEDGKVIYSKDYSNQANTLIRFKIIEEFEVNMLKNLSGLFSIKQEGDFVNMIIDSQHSDLSILKLLQLGCSIVSVNQM